ncbi:NCS1 family nucleobase:cation symporter-1 [Fimbriimonas ginsengisoli]|uniref:Uracil permease n=1 Tax=Fimbriimonas ginsengisoli Gsoil 348 TaxID=661478 RepID=A0A068NMY0_FIMGI|nr:NCS1 family nucleobase:cation symporter-1 [Fimbriimonas ginsengisoli]AIE84923.1 uracil permease [Fimbriimonas ginsengisoli Gsoil 348]
MSDLKLENLDLRPTTDEQRTWTWVHYAALWVGMAHCVPTWLMAGSLIALGLTWWQVIGIMALGNLIVLVPVVMNSHAGTRYGIPFPVLARASFGTRGANIPALFRGLVAVGWFGIQVHIGGGALLSLVEYVVPGVAKLNDTEFLSQGLANWISFGVFLWLNLVVLRRGMERLKKFELWAAPLVLLFSFALCIWAVMAAGGVGPVVNAPHVVPPDTHKLIANGLMAVIGFWSTLALNAPDFSRFAKTQRDQALGQALGLPTTMVLFSVLAVFTTSATAVLYGKVLWDPLEIVKHLPSAPLAAASLVAILLATVSVNVPANLVSPAYDFANLAPRVITMWRGALITAALATIIMPWRFMATAATYVIGWLNTSADLLGPVAGILIADYWLVRRKQLSVEDLYNESGRYRYTNGYNLRAILALAVALFASQIGRVFEPLRFLTEIGWVTGFLIGGFVYWLLERGRNQRVILGSP